MKKVFSFLFFAAGWYCFVLIIFLGVSDAQGKMAPDGYPLTPWTTYVLLLAGMFYCALLSKIFANWAENEKGGTPRPNKRRGKEKMVSCVCGKHFTAEFSSLDINLEGKNIRCPNCNLVFWYSISKEPGCYFRRDAPYVEFYGRIN